MSNAISWKHSVKERFLRYVQIDTQSDPHSKLSPSTEKQKDLGKILVEELKELGVTDAHLDEHGYVYASIAGTVDHEVPTICFCAHMDTSPDCSGAEVKPLVHADYDGSPISLPDDPEVIIDPAEHPDLLQQIGHDIITASGTTLLGADNKAGVAAIMDAVQHWMQRPEAAHGPLRILFTPDEEIGRGTAHLDLKKLNADFAYTVDGESRGSLDTENFCADAVYVDIEGVSAHPGIAKGKMINALKIAGEILNALPKDKHSPETTADREGFIHPVYLSGTAEQAVLHFIIRDFSESGLAAFEADLHQLIENIMDRYPAAHTSFRVEEQYRNMKQVLDLHPQVVKYAEAALIRSGLEPQKRSIRGGTDGARMSFMGLPTPNLFAGEHAFHSKAEWVSVQDMEKAAETLVHLAAIWAEKSM